MADDWKNEFVTKGDLYEIFTQNSIEAWGHTARSLAKLFAEGVKPKSDPHPYHVQFVDDFSTGEYSSVDSAIDLLNSFPNVYSVILLTRHCANYATRMTGMSDSQIEHLLTRSETENKTCLITLFKKEN